MDYVIKHCPECKGELHVPQDLKSCICMYCGKNIELKQEPNIAGESLEEAEKNYYKALDEIPELVKEYEYYQKHFTKDKYAPSFQKYMLLGDSILTPIDRYAAIDQDMQDEMIKATAERLVGAIENAVAEKTQGIKRAQKGSLVYQYRFFLTVFTVPMILSLELGISDALADNLIRFWGERFPEDKFLKATYDELAGGFNRKGFCFITTAVCDSMGKKDDCYELNAFRQFRDTYMMETQERQHLVEEYYKIAPVIVACIDTLPNSRDVYISLWDKYLKPCLEDIEQKQPEACEKHYRKMIEELKFKYNLNELS